jgi:hypothetical protein
LCSHSSYRRQSRRRRGSRRAGRCGAALGTALALGVLYLPVTGLQKKTFLWPVIKNIKNLFLPPVSGPRSERGGRPKTNKNKNDVKNEQAGQKNTNQLKICHGISDLYEFLAKESKKTAGGVDAKMTSRNFLPMAIKKAF